MVVWFVCLVDCLTSWLVSCSCYCMVYFVAVAVAAGAGAFTATSSLNDSVADSCIIFFTFRSFFLIFSIHRLLTLILALVNE